MNLPPLLPPLPNAPPLPAVTTEWFPAVQVSPVWPGEYEYASDGDIYRLNWNGKEWLDSIGVPFTPIDGDSWRGVQL